MEDCHTRFAGEETADSGSLNSWLKITQLWSGMLDFLRSSTGLSGKMLLDWICGIFTPEASLPEISLLQALLPQRVLLCKGIDCKAILP